MKISKAKKASGAFPPPPSKTPNLEILKKQLLETENNDQKVEISFRFLKSCEEKNQSI